MKKSKLKNIIREILKEGAWGHYPLDNDAASDWKWKFGHMILKELKDKLKGNESSYQYYAIGLWEFFKERLKTQYSFFTDEQIKEMDKLTYEIAKKLLESNYAIEYTHPEIIKLYLKNYINMYIDKYE